MIRRRRRASSLAARALLSLLGFVACVSCGYHLAGTNVSLPEDIKSIHVGDIVNDSRVPGLEKRLEFALQQAISRWGTYRLADDPGDGDAVLGGKVRLVDLRAVSFDQNDLVLQYEVSVVADLYLRRNSDGKVVWKISGLRQSDEYAAEAQVVVTSSSQFQQGTLDAVNLPQFTEVQLSESLGRTAMDRLLRDMARDAYAMMTEGF